ncbi:MAG: helix-turn-helix transcriptional regulator [Deltaproteobacteria bacterium]|nr:helix-turn-helix transcriptional regulator [Deltaproteobacteria bacterium]
MTTKPSQDKIDTFFNALQLSLDSRVSQVIDIDPEEYQNLKNLFFVGVDQKETDERLKYFTKIIAGRWLKDNIYCIDDIDTALSQEFINFLMLTRLNKENMVKLGQIDRQYKRFIKKLNLEESTNEVTVNSIEEARLHLFRVVEQKKMTLRVLAEQTKMTQVALSNFKNGSNIRLSNFISLCKALGVTIVLNNDQGDSKF